ncbi:hypothetical protein Zmor_021724 [Zophobas morio]|uniref:Reverse transcriptase n=1 Tax=Zophobas morio TaxID=2755281 RepID=A0AA38I6Q0_9CUCU|nr:hypothetical protein Zmor_021724 [Zophobas morio]
MSEKSRVTHDFVPSVRFASVWFELGMFGLFLLTGHGSMNEFFNKRGLSDTDLCACGRIENVWHIVFECGLYDEERRSCEWPGWIGEEERRFERLLESKEMYERRCDGVRYGGTGEEG